MVIDQLFSFQPATNWTCLLLLLHTTHRLKTGANSLLEAQAMQAVESSLAGLSEDAATRVYKERHHAL